MTKQGRTWILVSPKIPGIPERNEKITLRNNKMNFLNIQNVEFFSTLRNQEQKGKQICECQSLVEGANGKLLLEIMKSLELDSSGDCTIS